MFSYSILSCVTLLTICSLTSESLIISCLFLCGIYVLFFILLLTLNVEILGVILLMVYTSGILILLIYLCAVYEFRIFPETLKRIELYDDSEHTTAGLNVVYDIIAAVITFFISMLVFYPFICYFDTLTNQSDTIHYFTVTELLDGDLATHFITGNHIITHLNGILYPTTVDELSSANWNLITNQGTFHMNLLKGIEYQNTYLSNYSMLFDGLVYKIGILLCTVYFIPLLFVVVLFFVVLLGISSISYSGNPRRIHKSK